MKPDEVLAHVLAAAAEIFAQPVEAGDSFFSLGGDSVLAIELVAELERRLGSPVDGAALIEAATFTELAGELAGPAAEATWAV